MTTADREWLKTAPLEDVISHWKLVAAEKQQSLVDNRSPQMWRYFNMIQEHATTGVNYFKAVPFFTLPVSIQAKRLVELGSSFSDYPVSYGDPPNPWGVSSDRDEGVVSTRIMLAACQILGQFGVDSKLTSVDIRSDESPYQCAVDLLTEIGLIEYWDPQMGIDSLVWLKNERARIESGAALPLDFVLVDGNHTFDQVSQELTGVLPLMSSKGIIFVDDCYDTHYAHGADWIPEDSEDGLRRGGEHGSVLEFLETNKDWQADWFPYMVLLTRKK